MKFYLQSTGGVISILIIQIRMLYDMLTSLLAQDGKTPFELADKDEAKEGFVEHESESAAK